MPIPAARQGNIDSSTITDVHSNTAGENSLIQPTGIEVANLASNPPDEGVTTKSAKISTGTTQTSTSTAHEEDTVPATSNKTTGTVGKTTAPALPKSTGTADRKVVSKRAWDGEEHDYLPGLPNKRPLLTSIDISLRDMMHETGARIYLDEECDDWRELVVSAACNLLSE